MKKKTKGERIAENKQEWIFVEIRLFIFLKPVELAKQPDIEGGYKNGKTKSDDEELNDLFIK
jgi:hypothetical protein